MKIVHGSDDECIEVNTGVWRHCKGHELEAGNFTESCSDVLSTIRYIMRVPEGHSILAYTRRLVRRADVAGIHGNAL